jgi:hypothetical protein
MRSRDPTTGEPILAEPGATAPTVERVATTGQYL